MGYLVLSGMGHQSVSISIKQLIFFSEGCEALGNIREAIETTIPSVTRMICAQTADLLQKR